MLTCIIPCYNEEESLPYFYKEISRVFADMDCTYELIFVNDGSTDQTLTYLKNIAESDEHVIYLSFSRNFGKEAAMYAGLCHANGDYVAVMDADMQDPPSLLPQMLDLLLNGTYDSVATRRITRSGEPLIRSWFAHRFYQLINKISDTDIVDGARDFRLMKRSMVNAIIALGEYNRFSKGLFGWVGFDTKWLEYENVERSAGETKWSFWKLLIYSVEGIVGFTTAPLMMAAFIGLFFCLVAFAAICFIIIRTLLYGDPVSGWPSMTCIIVFLGGIQLFCIGILGEYLAKTYMETKRRPIFICKETNIRLP